MEYLPVLVSLCIASTIAFSILILSWFAGPRVYHAKKNIPFECGIPAIEDTHRRFSVRFYVIAILFLMFDIESIFFYPWALVYREMVAQSFLIVWEMLIFIGVLGVGYYYVLKRGALEWD